MNFLENIEYEYVTAGPTKSFFISALLITLIATTFIVAVKLAVMYPIFGTAITVAIMLLGHLYFIYIGFFKHRNK